MSRFDVTEPDVLKAIGAIQMPLTVDGYRKAWHIAASIGGPKGKALGECPHLVIVPPQLTMQAKMILEAAFMNPTVAAPHDAPGMDNPLRGTTDLLVNPELSGEPRRWYLRGNLITLAFEVPE